MKAIKCLLLSACLSLSCIAHAQKLSYGSLACLRGQRTVNLVLDFNGCRYDGEPIEIKMREEGPKDWAAGVAEITKRFEEEAYNECHINIGQYPQSRYKLIYHIYEIDDDEEPNGTMDLIDNSSRNVVAKLIKVNGDGGSFGSFFNLLGDAFEDLGENIGEMISDAVNGR